MPPPPSLPPALLPTGPISPEALRDAVAREADRLGFRRVGFTRVERFGDAAEKLRAWLDAGHAAGMTYLHGPDDRADPRALLPEARTLVTVALPYAPPVALRRNRDDGVPRLVPTRSPREAPGPPRETPGPGSGASLAGDGGPGMAAGGPRAGEPALVGAVAAYATGNDYHIVLRDKLLELAAHVRALLGRDVASRVCVDTAPLLEREAARRAGIGFVGKSTMVIAPGLGTRFLLGELLVDVDLPPTEPIAQGCGRCTACLTACPTDAFVAPFVLDARRCISYLTIETKDPIPRDLRSRIGTRVFGCDECQDVCPFNGSPAERPGDPELAPREALETPDLVELLTLGAAAYRKLVKRSALRRIGKVQLQRNAAVALGNTGDPRAVAPLADALRSASTASTRAHAAWALGRLGGQEARTALERARLAEADRDVREEIDLALAEARPETPRSK